MKTLKQLLIDENLPEKMIITVKDSQSSSLYNLSVKYVTTDEDCKDIAERRATKKAERLYFLF